MSSRVKWIATRGVYQIDRVEEVPASVPYRGTDGKIHGAVGGVRIVGYANNVAVIGVTLAGTHPATRANYREAMARKVQDAGGAWLGRSAASETAKADARVARETDATVTPNAADRKALRDAHYGRGPLPSTY